MLGTMHLLWGPNGAYCRLHERQHETIRYPVPRSAQQEHAVLGSTQSGCAGGPADFLDAWKRQGLGGQEEEHEQTSALVARRARAAERVVWGTWVSHKGECRISHDSVSDRLHYEEVFSSEDGERMLQGWLIRRLDMDRCWQSSVAVTVCGGEGHDLSPERVGDIEVRLGSGRPPSSLHLRIRVADEDDDWQPPVAFHRKPTKAAATARRGGPGRRSRGGRGPVA